MSRQNKQGAWVIPEEQVREFSKPINWDKLIADCMKQPYHRTLQTESNVGTPTVKQSRAKKKDSIWTREITIFGW